MADEENTVTLGEVVAFQDHLEESAAAVLGAADDKNCTYSEGYMKRQALYACLTCTPDVCDPAGFCLACNYHCHEGHNIIELYTKRNFRCDCGNEKFGGKKCTLEPNKDVVNSDNVYNQNFKGKYCSCARPYPDEEDATPDEMIQCTICEDWYHGRHLGVDEVPEDYCEMICIQCVEHCSFLKHYSDLLVKVADKEEETQSQESEEDKPNETSSTETTSANIPELVSSHSNEKPIISEEKENKINVDTLAEAQLSEKNKIGDDQEVDIETITPKECLIKQKMVSCTPPKSSVALFFQDGWRSQLCHCQDCMNLYKEKKISYITDENDMVEAYEKKGIDTPVPNKDADLRFLSTLHRTQQVEIISEYNSMKTKLVEYLKDFGENKKVVKVEDIHKFFSSLNECKRRRLNEEDLVPPSFCR